MNRLELQDRLNYCQRELIFLQAIKPNCKNCLNYSKGQCAKFGEIPNDFVDVGCEIWILNDVPF